MSDALHTYTHLFMVRLWVEDLGEGKTEWRGKVQHVTSSEVRYFRGWPMLITILQESSIKPEDVIKDAKETT